MKPGELFFLPLGGAGEIGMNLNLYGFGGKWLMVDLGITFADESLPGADVIVPDPAWIVDRREDLLGIVITHAHEDHVGAVPHLWPQLRVPVYATAFTASILRAKLAEAGLEDEVPVRLFAPGKPFELGPFKLTAIAITHSIPESQALAIETPAGLVLHSGDWKIDPVPLVGPATDITALESFGERGVLALVCDSTNVFYDRESGSESGVYEGLRELLKDRAGRIAVTTFASNIARLESIAKVGQQLGRQVCLVGRSLWRMNAAARENGYLQDVPEFLTDRDAGYLPNDRVLFVCTGCQGEPRGAMARIAAGDHPQVVLGPGDIVVFSSRIIPGNERTIGRVHNALALRGVEVITEKNAPVHVSGHPSRHELAKMYRWVRPRIAVPVHGEPRHLLEHARLAESLQVPRAAVVRNGQMLRLAPGDPEVVEEVPSGRMVVDGDSFLLPQGPVLQARKRMMYNGTALVTLVLDRTGEPLAEPRIALRGIGDGEAEGGALAAAAVAAVDAALARLDDRAARDDAAVEEAVRRAVRRVARDERNRRPLVAVHVMRVPAVERRRAAAE